MKLVKVALAAVGFLAVSAPAMAVGEFRAEGVDVREGQLICQNVSASYRKQESNARPAASESGNRQVAEAANSTSAN